MILLSVHAPGTYPVQPDTGYCRYRPVTEWVLVSPFEIRPISCGFEEGPLIEEEVIPDEVTMPKSYRWDVAPAIFGISRHHRAWLGRRNKGNSRPKGAGTSFMPRTGLYMCMHRHSMLFHGVMSGGFVHQRCIWQRVAAPAPQSRRKFELPTVSPSMGARGRLESDRPA